MKICIIIPYFGDFPNYFQLFLNSCEKNVNYDWLIITDNQRVYKYPSNVSCYRINFIDLKEIIQNKFEFKISLNSYHKLCEYKPAYGYIFEDLIVKYEFWGYGDLDIIYGNLNNFISDEMFKYLKIFTLGHFSLLKNTYENNRRFMNKIHGVELYKRAFTSNKNFNFDEEFMQIPNVNNIFTSLENGLWKNSKIADIYVKSSKFLLTWCSNNSIIIEKKSKSFFVWKEGHILRYEFNNNRTIKTEYMYIHLQKRPMRVDINQCDAKCYKIVPNAFEAISTENEKEYHKEKMGYINLQYFRIRVKNLRIKLFGKCTKKY